MIDNAIIEKDYEPDFVIGGAMKCGTTTLHHILEQHPDIFISKDEEFILNIDDIFQHKDFNHYSIKQRKWFYQEIEVNKDLLKIWYSKKFGSTNKTIKGEDATTYLASKKAAERLSKLSKPVKIIFILRQPSLRAFSNYLHLFKTGRAIYDFEDTIRFYPESILTRSLYKEQLEYYYKLFPKEQIKVVLFEDLVENPHQVIEELCSFLGVDYSKLNKSALNTHSNKTKLPKYFKLHLYKNRLVHKYKKQGCELPNSFEIKTPIWIKYIDKVHKKINKNGFYYKLKIKPETKDFLDDFFKKELEGIDELIGQEILKKWF